MALVTGSIVNKEDIINKFKANIIDIVTSNAYSNSNIPRINGRAGTFSAVVQADLGGVNEIQNISLDNGIINGTVVYNIMIAVMKNCSRVRNFTSNLVGKISGAVHELKGMDGVDKEGINNQKQKIEKLVGLYERYLYTLKEQGWNFNGADNESGIETIGYDTLDEMARVQRQFDMTFTMPIPRN